MPIMLMTDFLKMHGWEPVDRELMLWRREDEPEPVTIFWAAHKQGLGIPHCWNGQFSCEHCGTTQYRVFLLEESPICMGVPDAKAFADAANFEKLKQRIADALNGEEGMVWDSKND